MTQEEKQLLLKDLSARLPHNVVIRCTDSDTDYNCFLTTDILHEIQNDYEYYDYKPYLRPMSSMTASETMEYTSVCVKYAGKPEIGGLVETLLEFYCSHHLDYRGLIEKGIALEAPEGMYKTK